MTTSDNWAKGIIMTGTRFLINHSEARSQGGRPVSEQERFETSNLMMYICNIEGLVTDYPSVAIILMARFHSLVFHAAALLSNLTAG
jgi:hypothetical protein